METNDKMEMLSEDELKQFTEQTDILKDCMAHVVVGQRQTIDLMLTAILAGGHVLLEGVPGVAKTLMAKLMARLIEANFSRIQFTPDLMPSDLLGTSVLNLKSGEFEFHRGPVFSNLVLVDEINRAPAKTQAALFEVMEEKQVTVDGVTYPMDELYVVVATQNPVEQEGTYKLPEAQLDRFLMKITVDYPTAEEEMEMLLRHQQQAPADILATMKPVMSRAQIVTLRKLVDEVYTETSLLNYMVQIVQQTRHSKAVFLGASPRATVGILRSSKAYALLQGRAFVTPEDVKFVAPYVLQHRLILTAEAEMEGLSVVNVVKRLIDKVEVPQ